MRAHFGARYTWPRRGCAGCRTAVADHLLLETKGYVQSVLQDVLKVQASPTPGLSSSVDRQSLADRTGARRHTLAVHS